MTNEMDTVETVRAFKLSLLLGLFRLKGVEESVAESLNDFYLCPILNNVVNKFGNSSSNRF